MDPTTTTAGSASGQGTDLNDGFSAAHPELVIRLTELESGLRFEPENAAHALHLRLDRGGEVHVTPTGQATPMLLRAAASFFVPAGIAFNWRVGFGLRVLSVYLPRPAMLRLADDQGAAIPSHMELREPAHDPVLEHYAALIQHEFSRAQGLSEHFLAPIARLLGQHCLRNYMLRAPIREQAATLAPELRKRLDDFIVKTLPNAVIIEELAQAVRLSQYQLIRMMKKTLAMSPQQYVQERRMDIARKLLRESDSPLADIAYTLGFSSQSHFTSAFRASTGHTPKAYRERPDLI